MPSVALFAQLEDVSVQYLISGTTSGSYLGCGLSCADFNGDGWDDLTFSETDGMVRLYQGGELGMELVQSFEGVGEGRSVLWIDVDQDGDLDLWVARSDGKLELFIQGPNGVLTEESDARGIPELEGFNPRGMSACDYDRDGDLDVYVAAYHITTQPNFYSNLLLQNDGAGHFVDVADSAGVGNGIQTTFQGAWLDYDDDGWDDLWVINDRFLFPNAMYRNLGDGTFVDVAPELGLDDALDPMTATVFDPDQDGDWDLFATDVPNLPHSLYAATDSGYIEVAESAGVAGLTDYGWGGCVLDIDGDRREDLMVATSPFPSEASSDNRIYIGNESGLGFTENPAVWPNEQYPLYHLGRLDLDGDRSPDVACHGSIASLQLLRTTNDGGAARMALRLVGTVSNSHAVGARIRVHSGGKVQMQQVDAGADYQTQHSFSRFFGLDNLEVVDSIEVRWPTGVTETWVGLSADTAAVLIEGTANATLTALAQECPWSEQGWLVPFPSDSVDMTWNGVPVQSDTVWAEFEGIHLLEATWWDGRFSWSQSVQAVTVEEPQLTLTSDSALCPWDSVVVSWSAPEWGTLSVNGEVSEANSLWLNEAGPVVAVWTDTSGCSIETGLEVTWPPEAVTGWAITSPSCAGDFGAATLSVQGGTPPWTVDWEGLDPQALPVGSHPVQVVDAVGCTVLDTVSVQGPDSLQSWTTVEHSGLSDTAWVSLTVTGGTPPYDVEWTGGFGNGGALSPAVLGWLVEDANGCVLFGTVDVPGNPLQVGEMRGWSMQCHRDAEGVRFSGIFPVDGRVRIFDPLGRNLFDAPLTSHSVPLSSSSFLLIQVLDGRGNRQAWVR